MKTNKQILERMGMVSDIADVQHKDLVKFLPHSIARETDVFKKYFFLNQNEKDWQLSQEKNCLNNIIKNALKVAINEIQKPPSERKEMQCWFNLYRFKTLIWLADDELYKEIEGGFWDMHDSGRSTIMQIYNKIFKQK